MQSSNATAILRHVTTNTIYKHVENDLYKNLSTGKTGTIKPEQASRIFKLNVELTEMFAVNPVVELLIERLKLTPENKLQ